MKKLFFLFFLLSCAPPNSSFNPTNIKLDFNDNLSFEDFNELLNEYTKISPYPNIDK
jgi:hypothetical protein